MPVPPRNPRIVALAASLAHTVQGAQLEADRIQFVFFAITPRARMKVLFLQPDCQALVDPPQLQKIRSQIWKENFTRVVLVASRCLTRAAVLERE